MDTVFISRLSVAVDFIGVTSDSIALGMKSLPAGASASELTSFKIRIPICQRAIAALSRSGELNPRRPAARRDPEIADIIHAVSYTGRYTSRYSVPTRNNENAATFGFKPDAEPRYPVWDSVWRDDERPESPFRRSMRPFRVPKGGNRSSVEEGRRSEIKLSPVSFLPRVVIHRADAPAPVICQTARKYPRESSKCRALARVDCRSVDKKFRHKSNDGGARPSPQARKHSTGKEGEGCKRRSELKQCDDTGIHSAR